MAPRRTRFVRRARLAFAVEHDRAFGDLAALECSRFEIAFSVGLRAVGAEQHDDAALRDIERHALEHEDDVVVDDLNVVDGEDVGAVVTVTALSDTADWTLIALSSLGYPSPLWERVVQRMRRLEPGGKAQHGVGYPSPRARAPLSHKGEGAFHYDDFSQGSVRFGQPVVEVA